LRILTLNVHKGFSLFHRRFVLHELRDAIRSTAADLVFLQEVVGANDLWAAKHPGWPVSSQYEFLADEVWSTYAYGKNAVTDVGHHGNAILSRHPIVRWQNVDVSLPPSERRALLHCRIDVGDEQLHAVCVHFGLTEAHRRFQLRGLQALIDREIPKDAPLVVAGDFNDWFGLAGSIMEEGLGMQEVHKARFGAYPRTFPARRPMLRLDRIYLRNFQTQDPVSLPGRPWSALSDHLPVLATAMP